MAKKRKQPRWNPTAWQLSAIGAGTGVLLGTLAAGVTFALIDEYDRATRAARAPTDRVTVLVASRDLMPGVVIAEQDVYVVEMPVELVHPDVLRAPEQALSHYTRERVYANELLRGDRMSNPERGHGLNAIIPTHLRALSLELFDGAALSGHLQPGSYVDVLGTFEDESDGRPFTVTVTQGLFVLAVNENPVLDLTPEETRMVRSQPRPSVTLLVTPEEAERVAHADHLGVVRLSLRNDLDHETVMSGGVDMNSLLARLRPAGEPHWRTR